MNSNLVFALFDRNRQTPHVALGTENVYVGLVQDLERNEIARRLSSIGKKYLVARSLTKGDDMYSLVWACV